MSAYPTQTNKKQTENIDALDKRILNLLQQDCRLSFNKIAAQADISVGTAYNRIKNLEAKGLVTKYTALIDSIKLGYSLTAIIFVQAKGDHLEQVEKEIATDPNVATVYDVTGEFDAVVVAKFKDREELNKFVKHLAALTHVKRTITTVSLSTVKEDFRMKLP